VAIATACPPNFNINEGSSKKARENEIMTILSAALKWPYLPSDWLLDMFIGTF
jgi:hypothetical protein